MSRITVKELKDRLNGVLDDLNDLDDDQEIRLVSNTYFLGNSRMFLGLAGYNGGYLDLDCVFDSVEESEDEDDR